MAITFKFDLYGSSLIQGASDKRLDRGNRLGRATGVPNTPQGLYEACNQAIIQQGNLHPAITDLPLESVRSHRFGPEKTWVSMRYGRSPSNTPTQPASALVRSRFDSEYITVYRSTVPVGTHPNLVNPNNPVFDAYGQPGGQIDGHWTWANNPGDQVYPHSGEFGHLWKRGIIRMVVPTVLSVDPTPTIIPLLDTINLNPVTFAGYLVPKGGIHFNSASVDWFEVVENGVSKIKYAVNYYFTVKQGGFATQVPLWASIIPNQPATIPEGKTPSTTARWVVTHETDKAFKEHAGAFPVHA